MERREYEKLALADERMWWFRALQANLIATFMRRAGDGEGAGGAVLDAGCGTGGLLARLAAGLPGREPPLEPWGMDIDAGACAVARAKSGRPVCVGSINAMPFADNSLAAIFSADVLCHRGVDEAAALAGFHRCLKPGGMLLLNLPAHPWLYSAHDRAVDNARRYSRAGLRRLIERAGFAACEIGYWNGLLFPLMLLRRKLQRRDAAPRSEVRLLPAPVEWAFRTIARLETLLIAQGARLPVGGSIIAVGVKPGVGIKPGDGP